MVMIQVQIRLSDGTKFSVDVETTLTVGKWKEQLVETLNVPAIQQRLIYKGRVMKDDSTLDTYGLQATHTVHMVRGTAPKPSTSSPSTSSSTTNSSNSGNSNTNTNPTPPLFNPFAMPNFGTGNNGNNPNGQQDLSSIAAMQQQLMASPELMQNMLNSPLMQQLLSSPDIFQSMIDSNPAMRQIMEQNPQLAHVLRDPQTLQTTLQALRSPAARRDLLAHQDQALRNIESHPEGFNALRRMYHEVQEPLMQAANDGSNPANPFGGSNSFPMPGTTGGNSSTSSTTQSAPNAPLPNPWASSTTSNTTSNANNNINANANSNSNPFMNPFGMMGNGGDNARLTQDLLNTMQQNPALQQMMQNMMSDPAIISQMEQMNPQFRSMLDANPQMRQMLQNPEFLRSMADPQNLQAMIQLQASMNQLQQSGAFPGLTNPANSSSSNSNPNPANPSSNSSVPPMDFSQFLNAMGGMQTPTNINNAATNSSSPEQLYASQLTQLQEMGFTDQAQNLRALQLTFGNVNAAVERILNGAV